MNKLDESEIIKIFQRELGNKKFVSEDVEMFSIGNNKIVAKVDTLVQSTDIPKQMSLSDAARKSIVASISDFAAKGVKPEFGIISVNLPATISRSEIKQISKGIRTASKEFCIKILGGDTNEGKEIVFHACIFGKTDKIVTRGGAKVGDIIFVTGPFGYTAAGLKILLQDKKGEKKFVNKALKSVLKPKAQIKFGLQSRKYLSSSMDSSDGLSTTLNQMSTQSNKKFVIVKIPTLNDLYDFARKNKLDPKDLVFNGGEEYEIVFTVSKRSKSQILNLASKIKIPIIEIGYVTKGKGAYIKENQKLVKIEDRGWHHFKSQSPKR